MLPDRISFTELELSPTELLTPRKLEWPSYPAEWVRHQFDVPADMYLSLPKLDRWIETNLTGRWGSYSVYTMRGTTVVLVFEEVTDAVMFRLQGGERAWAED